MSRGEFDRAAIKTALTPGMDPGEPCHVRGVALANGRLNHPIRIAPMWSVPV